MLKYGCNGVSWWKNADIDMMESFWSAWLQAQLLFLRQFCLVANLRPGRKLEDGKKESLLVSLRSKPLLIPKKRESLVPEQNP